MTKATMLNVLVTIIFVAAAYVLGDAKVRSFRQVRALVAPLAQLLDRNSAVITVHSLFRQVELLKREVQQLTRRKEELTSAVSALQQQSVTPPTGSHLQQKPQPDAAIDMCCVSLLKHRLYDTEEINSRQGMRIRSLEAQLEEVKRQSLSKLATAEKRIQCFKNQLIRHQNKSDEHVAATEQQWVELQQQLACSKRDQANAQQQLHEAESAKHQLETDALHQATSFKPLVNAVPSSCACGKATCLQQALHLHQSQRTHLSERVKAYFQTTGTDKVGAYLKRNMAAEHKAVEARLWEKLVQMFAAGKGFGSSDISQDAELTEQLQSMTKEWLLFAIDMSDLCAQQAVDCLLHKQYTVQKFISRCLELHEAKCRGLAPSSTPAAATPRPAQPSLTSYKGPVFAPATPTYASSGSRAAAHDTYSSAYFSPSYQPSTPPRTSGPQPQCLSADGTEGIGSRGGRMHLNSNDNWTYSRHQSHHVSNGPSNQPAYTAADGLTGKGARGAAMYQTRTGSWRYESQRRRS